MTTTPVLANRLDGNATAGGAPLLLLNGGFMTVASWAPLAERLGAGRRLLRCDFRGQLLTPGRAHRVLGDNVDDVVALLDHAGIARVHVLGTSFGGMVGLLLAARRPERVASLVAVTVADRATEAMSAATRRLRRDVAAVLADGGDRGRFYDLLVPDIFSAGYVAASGDLLALRRRQVAALPDAWFGALDDLLAAVEVFDLRPELGGIRCPSLVAVAGDDRVLPPERGRAVAGAVPGARVVEHPTSGHTLVVEEPEWLVGVVERFLGEGRWTGWT